jgi:hypothetical protein
VGVLRTLRASIAVQVAQHFAATRGAGLPTVVRADPPPEDEAEAARRGDALARDLDLSDLDTLRPTAARVLQAVGELGAAAATGTVKVLVPTADDFALPHERIVAYAETRAAELVGKRVLADGAVIDNPDARFAITEGTRTMLRETFATAFREQWTHDQVEDALADGYAFSRSRAALIAQTELSKAYVEANLATAEASGVVSGKSSILGSEHDDDYECDENAAAGVIPIGAAFPSGDQAAPYHPGCRCDCLYEV